MVNGPHNHQPAHSTRNSTVTAPPRPLKFPAHTADTSSHVPFLRGISMARGRRTSFTITLTDEERQTLLAWQRSTNNPAGIARRGRIILILAARAPSSQLAATVRYRRRLTQHRDE